jgi:hypothetical protein
MHIQHHDLDCPNPNLQQVGGVHSSPTRNTYLNFLCSSNFQKNVQGQGVCEMHMPIVFEKK